MKTSRRFVGAAVVLLGWLLLVTVRLGAKQGHPVTTADHCCTEDNGMCMSEPATWLCHRNEWNCAACRGQWLPPIQPTNTSTVERVLSQQDLFDLPMTTSNNELMVVLSQDTNRSTFVPFHGAKISGIVYVFLNQNEGIDRVKFFIDGERTHIERRAPFDLGGTTVNDIPLPIDSGKMSLGTHTLITDLRLSSGDEVTLEDTFTVVDPRASVVISYDMDRKSAVPLDGQMVSGTIFVFVEQDDGILAVDFFIDGSHTQREKKAPFDLAGTRPSRYPRPFYTSDLSVGNHSLTTVLQFLSGDTLILGDDFEVVDVTSTGTGSPTESPSHFPTAAPTSKSPTVSPTEKPKSASSVYPSGGPSILLTGVPTVTASSIPSNTPTFVPTKLRTAAPTVTALTNMPTHDPTYIPTDVPTRVPTDVPTYVPTKVPTSTGFLSVVLSKDTDRSTFVPFEGTRVSGNIYVFVNQDEGIRSVRFFIDGGVRIRKENWAPYDLGATGKGGEALPFDAGTLALGEHILTTIVELSSGDWERLENTFTAVDPDEGDSTIVTAVPTTSPTILTAVPTPTALPTESIALKTTSPTVLPTEPEVLSSPSPTVSPSTFRTTSPISPGGAHACLPAEQDSRAVRTQLEYAPGQEVVLQRSDQLCTLWQVNPSISSIIPVGRSYLGHEWEGYSTTVLQPVSFDCDSSFCIAILPELSDGFFYELAAFDHRLPFRDEVARFLEQATFGPTREALDSFSGSFAGWVKDQQENVPLTSHRAYFRERLYQPYDRPGEYGLVSHPCRRGSFYRKSAIPSLFAGGWGDVEFRTDSTTGRSIVGRGGQAYTVVGANLNIEDGSYDICYRISNDDFRIDHPDRGCIEVELDGKELGNPVVYFDDLTPPTNPTVNLDGLVSERDGDLLLLESDLDDDVCALVPPLKGRENFVVVGYYAGSYWVHDPRLDAKENTLENPIPDGGGGVVEQTALEEDSPDWTLQARCMNPGMTPFNQDSCRLSYDDQACSPSPRSYNLAQAYIDLTVSTFQRIYELSGGGDDETRYIYAVRGLRQSGDPVPYSPPCSPGAVSRWTLASCDSGLAVVSSETTEVFESLLYKSQDTNPYIRDIIFPAVGISCGPGDGETFDFVVEVGGECWLNVHRSYLQVYDFTKWVYAHNGGPDKITQFAVPQGDVDPFLLTFPSWHGMDRWYGTESSYLDEIGRFGDSLSFSDLSSELLELIDVEDVVQGLGSTVVCGSPYEVKTDTLDTDGYFESVYYGYKANRHSYQKATIWVLIALNSRDGLRQRVAWALSQILVISPEGVGNTVMTEAWTSYYDIFVRHAFGSYRDILKEVSFSPMMGKMLTYADGRSTHYAWDRNKRVEFADENYAREIMQLFSIGLIKLNNDGSPILDQDGKPIRTYSNDHIMEYARSWTAFHSTSARGNIETNVGRNLVDHMEVQRNYRDSLPKLGLDGRYVGDGLPLCSELPYRHFLRSGATYVLRGSSATPKYLYEPGGWYDDASVVRLRLDSGSELRQKMCNSDISGQCQYQGKVVLDVDLVCSGDECDIESPRLLEVESGIFYEYVRVPCAYQAFFSGGRALKVAGEFLCADPQIALGAIGCCTESSNKFSFDFGRFSGEMVTYSLAEDRCANLGMDICTNPRCNNCESMSVWTTALCTQQAKIGLDGTIALVHAIPDLAGGVDAIEPLVREDTKTFFRVKWSGPIDELLSNYEDVCETLGCGRDSFDNLCLCPVEVEETVAFEIVPTRQEVLEELALGSVDPKVLWKGSDYTSTIVGGDVTVHARDGLYSTSSIFEVLDHNGITQYRKNVRSKAVVGSAGNAGLRLSFQNPTHMMSITSALELRDVLHETDAVLDQYFYHPNTAPFLAVRFAQRFGLSNPSPRLVDTVATAFRSGRYIDLSTGTSFGSGEYGNLGAMVAALLLDRESRSVVLDADPASGSVLEPLLRYIRLMKSLEFVPDYADRNFQMIPDVMDWIGQMPHAHPNVFSFFLPNFQPAGPVVSGGLLCPECQLLTESMTINLMNGCLSLLKYGWSMEDGGFGTSRDGTGKLAYNPSPDLTSEGVVDELATLLTSGRLSQEKRKYMTSVFEKHDDDAMEILQQMIAGTPEFHSNSLSRGADKMREEPADPQPSSKPYKAVVHVMLPGGMDSYNLLVPAECEDRNSAGQTVLEQYESVRSFISLSSADKDLQISATNQPCSRFAIHPRMEVAKQLYEEDSLMFFANTGLVADATMTKESYGYLTPSQLFSHNSMQLESKLIDTFRDQVGTGILGRMAGVLESLSFKTNAIAVGGTSQSVFVDPSGAAPNPITVGKGGVVEFLADPEVEGYMKNLNNATDSFTSLFGETFSEVFTNGIRQGRSFNSFLEATSLQADWPAQKDRSFETVARLMQTRDKRGIDRDLFFLQWGSWDHHGNLISSLNTQLDSLNTALRSFMEEMKAQGMWDDVAIVITSEFGRTLSPNSRDGTDHAWGGNYMALGGSMKGGRVLGQYPDDLTTSGRWNVGRGRMMPSTSWEAIWHGISEWMGSGLEQMEEIMPNLRNTYGGDFTPPFSASDLFN